MYYPGRFLLALTLFVGEPPTLRGADRALGLGVVEWSKEIGPGWHLKPYGVCGCGCDTGWLQSMPVCLRQLLLRLKRRLVSVSESGFLVDH
jgi:hypothetical protein